MSGGVTGPGKGPHVSGPPDLEALEGVSSTPETSGGGGGGGPTVVRGGPPRPKSLDLQAQSLRADLDAKLDAHLKASLQSWKADKTQASRVTADALPLPALVPAEQKLHADVEKTLYAARGDVALGTLISRAKFDEHVARNRPAVLAQRKLADDMAARYEAAAALEQDPERRAGLALRGEYYRGLAVSIEARFDEIVALNSGQCDLRHGKLPAGPTGPTTLPKLEKIEADGKLKTGWNDLAAQSLNEARKLDLRKTSKEELEKVVKGAFPDETAVPAGDREKYKAAVAGISKELTSTVLALPPTENAMAALTGLIDGSTRYLHAQITFARKEEELKQEVAEKGGLYPGEEKAAEAAVAPVAAEVEKAKVELDKKRAEIKAKLKTGGGADVDLDKDYLFVKSAKGDVAVEWAGGDFKAKIYTKVKIDKPLTEGARAEIDAGAEVSKGKFSAQVHGHATVERLWTDPVFGPTATVDFNLKYDDAKLKGTLSGKALLPMGPGSETNPSLHLDGRVDYASGNWSTYATGTADLAKGAAPKISTGAGVAYGKGKLKTNAGVTGTFGAGGQPSYGATVGLSYKL